MGYPCSSIVKTSIFMGLMALSASAQFPSYMPPASNPPAADYEPQGEYVGAVQGTGAKLGAHLVSRGGSRFDVALLPGGLLDLTKENTGTADPNGGWDGKTRYAVPNITLNGTTFTATINGGGATYQLTSITGTGANRVLNGTVGGNAFALIRKTRENGIGGERQAPTLGLRPEGKTWSTGFQSWFVDGNKATQAEANADLTKWKNRDNGVQLKFGNFLFRGIESAATHGTILLHIEARNAFMPTATGQDRGNSGVYLRGMHEQQVLDSFGIPTAGVTDILGAVYKIKEPAVNAALPPLTWQVYDIYYTAGTGQSGTFTTYLNGVKVQDGTTASGPTLAGPNNSKLYLQNHGNDVVFNNIWMIPNATPTSHPYNTLRDPVVVIRPHRSAPNGARTALLGNSGAFFDIGGRSIRGEAPKLPTLLLHR